MRAALAIAVALLAGTGCSTVERLLSAPLAFPARATSPAPATPPAPVTLPAAVSRVEQSTADELVDYAGRLRGLSESALAAEVARQRQAAARDGSDVARLKVAIGLALSAQADESEILTAVDPIVRRDGSDAQARAMASFLQVIAHERRRLKESAAAAGVRLRDERRALESEKQRAEALQERAAQLQQKLDALTELEKSLSDRPPGR